MDQKLQINLKFIGTATEEIKKNDVINIDDNLHVIVKNINQSGLGFGSSQVIIEYLFNVFLVGVPSSLIATLIYDKFLQGKNRLIDETREVTIITKEELVKYIELLKNEQLNKEEK